MKLIFTCFLLGFVGVGVSGQPSVNRIMEGMRSKSITDLAKFEINPKDASLASALFTKESNLKLPDAKSWLKEKLQMRSTDDLVFVNRTEAKDGIVIEKYQQYYKGIRVEHGVVNVTSQASSVKMMHMEFYSINDSLNTIPVITEAQALQKAMKYIGATKYVWDDYIGTDSNLQKPKGKLVILQDYYKNGNGLCLAYKFMIHAMLSFLKNDLYISTIDGSLILKNNLISYSNEVGQAQTIYSANQFIITDYFGIIGFRKYRLQQRRNDATAYAHNIATLNSNNDQIEDDDNVWPIDIINNGALDVHFNMQVISDYWNEKHQRNSWDGMGKDIKGFVHKSFSFACNNQSTITSDNASFDNRTFEFWYGDGATNAGNHPYVTLDICAHEFGHGIFLTQMNGVIVNSGEPGTLNEGFSDIWGACVENYANQHYNFSQNKKVWIHSDELNYHPRNLQDPSQSIPPQPSVYNQLILWRDPKNIGCDNDNGGIHANTGVLNKWFYLITEPTVGGMGFSISEKIIYLTELNLSPNSDYRTAAAVSINAVTVLSPNNPQYIQKVKDAWIAVGVISTFNMSNTNNVFTTNDFTSIGIGKDRNIWAGTIRQGIYKFNGIAWEKEPFLSQYAITDIKSDQLGGIWISHTGSTSTLTVSGGIYHFLDASFTVDQFTQSHGLAGSKVNSLFVNKLKYNGILPLVWSAENYHTYYNNYYDGGISKGLNTASPTSNAFTPIRDGIIQDGFAACLYIGGNSEEIWALSPRNGQWRVLKYSATTNAFLSSVGYPSTPAMQDFVGRAVYFDKKNNKWLGKINGGVLVYDVANQWNSLNFLNLFPAGTAINSNAITGDGAGRVYIGTTNGLVIYNGSGPINVETSFKRYTTDDGLPSNNIKQIAYDGFRDILLLATDNGIAFWKPVCTNCPKPIFSTSSIKSGNWSDPATWEDGRIPDSNTDVIINSTNVIVDKNGTYKSLRVTSPGGIIVKDGVNFDQINN